MAVQADQLDIKINLDIQADATKQIGKIVSGIKTLKNTVNGADKVESFAASINSLSDSFGKLQNSKDIALTLESAFAGLSDFLNNFDPAQFTEGMSKVNDVIDDLAKSMDKISDASIDKFYKISDALDSLSNQSSPIKINTEENMFGKISGVIGKIPGGGSFAKLTAEIGEMGAAASGAVGALGIAGAAIGAIVAEYKILKAWLTDVNKVFDEHVAILKRVGAAAADIAAKLGSGVVSAFKAAGQAGRTFLDAIRGIGDAIASLKERMDNSVLSISKAVQGMIKTLTKTLRMVFNTLTRMTIRKVLNLMFSQLKEALDRLVNYSRYAGTQFAKSMDMFATSTRYFGNSFMAMVSPIVNAVMPVLDMLVDRLVDVMNHINEFISFMSGASSWTSAIKVPIQYATAAEKAAEKQKKLNNTILAFDELNRLDGKNDQDSSMEGVYEFKENPFGDWLTGLKDLDSLFEKLGVKLKGFTTNLKQLLAGINWDSIYAAAEKMGRGVMSLLNIIFGDSALAKLLGETLGKTVNTAFHFAHGAIEEWAAIDWGIAFTNFINGALESLDWGLIQGTIKRLGERLSQYFNAIFHEKTMWENIGTAFSNGFNTVIIGLQAFIEGLNFVDMGRAIGTALDNALKNINFETIFTTLSEVINGVFDTLIGICKKLDLAEIAVSILDGIDAGFKTLNWGKINTSLQNVAVEIVTTLNAIFGDEKIWNDLGTTIGNGFTVAINFIHTVVSRIDWGTVGSSLGQSLSSMFERINWTGLGDTLANLLNGLFAGIKGYFSNIDWVSLGSGITTGIKSMLDGLDWETIKTSVISIGESLGTLFNEIFTDTEMWARIGTSLGNAVSVAIQGLAAFLSELDPKETANSIITFFDNAINSFIGDEKNVEALNNIISWAVSLVENLIAGWDSNGMYEKIKGFLEKINWDSLFGAVSKLMVTVAITKLKIEFDMFALKSRIWIEEKFELLKGIIENFGGTILTVLNYMFRPMETLLVTFLGIALGWIVKHFGEIQTVVAGVWETLKKITTDTWDNIQRTVTNTASAIWKNVTGVFTNIYKTVTGTVQDIWKGITDKFEAIRKGISDKIEAARKAVENAIGAMRKLFDFTWSLPAIKLPHFRLEGGEAPWGLGGYGSLPHFSVDWHSKAMNKGMILNGATIFGVNNSGGLLGGGEAGSEAVVGTGSLAQMIMDSVSSAMNSQSIQAAVASGVASAMSMVDNAPTVDMTLNVDSETLYRMVRKGQSSYNGRYRIIEGVT